METEFSGETTLIMGLIILVSGIIAQQILL